MMVENEVDVAGFNSLTELKKAVQQEKIKQRIYAEYAKTPIGKEPNRKKLAKLIGVSENTISMAFEDTARPKESSDFNKTITKALGIATPMLLLQEENISKISDFLNDNEELAAMAGGLYLTWNQFVKPRIDDPKNELSELEVVIELFKSQVGQAFVGGIFGILGVNKLIKMFKDEVIPLIDGLADKFRDGFINFGLGIGEVIDDVEEIIEKAKEELRDIFGLNSVICLVMKDGKLLVFPNYDDWVDAQGLALRTFYKMPSGVALGIAAYKIAKTNFINECGKENVVDYEQYITNPNAFEIIKEEEEEEEEIYIPPVLGGGGGEEELEQPKGTPIRLTPGSGGSAPIREDEPEGQTPVIDSGEGLESSEPIGFGRVGSGGGGVVRFIEPESLIIKKT